MAKKKTDETVMEEEVEVVEPGEESVDDEDEGEASSVQSSEETAEGSDDVQSLIKKVREEEKSKLYGRIETLKKEKSDLESQMNGIQDQLKEMKAALTGKDEEKQTEIQKLTGVVNGLQEQILNMNEQMVQEREDAQKKQRQLELDNYRAKKISEARGKIIPQMVHGTTEVEIDASVLEAKSEYLKIYNTGLKRRSEEIEVEETETPLVQPIQPTREENAGQPTVDQINDMSMDEYEKHRKEILKSARQ